MKRKANELDDKEEDVWDRFSDPVKKAKRKKKRKARQQSQADLCFYRGKLFAVDMFNTEPTAEQLETWKKSIDWDVEWVDEKAKAFMKGSHAKMVPYTKIKCDAKNPFRFIAEYLHNLTLLKPWFKQELKRWGWLENCTGYDPFKVSHSFPELKMAIVECLKMALKQRRWIEKSET